MAIGIYKITNKINGKCYIGQSVNITERWKAHRTRSMNNFPSNKDYDSHFYRSIRKYGLENFDFEIIEECSIDELDEKEQFYINKYNSSNQNFGYNVIDDNFNRGNFQLISKEELLEIIDLLKNTTLTQQEIADKFNIAQSSISQINTGKQLRQENIIYPIREVHHKEQKYCKICGKPITRQAVYCEKCVIITKTKEKPISREELKQLIRIIPFTKIGEQFNVSDNAIRKWCEKYNLPKRKKDIEKYSDEEWENI